MDKRSTSSRSKIKEIYMLPAVYSVVEYDELTFNDIPKVEQDGNQKLITEPEYSF